jgi:hypothetical protein
MHCFFMFVQRNRHLSRLRRRDISSAECRSQVEAWRKHSKVRDTTALTRRLFVPATIFLPLARIANAV